MQQEEQDLKHQLSEENAKIADLEETWPRIGSGHEKGEEEAAKLFTSEKKKRELQSNLEELIRRTLLLLMNELPKRTWTALNVNWRM